MTSIFTAAGAPDRPAYIMAQAGVMVSYGELEADSNRYAQFFRSLGLQAGDHIAMMFGPNEATLKVVWAARRSGLVYTIISPHLTAAETAYIIADCTARIVVTDAACLEQVLTASKSLDQPVAGLRRGLRRRRPRRPA